jgi:hypothetical protein
MGDRRGRIHQRLDEGLSDLDLHMGCGIGEKRRPAKGRPAVGVMSLGESLPFAAPFIRFLREFRLKASLAIALRLTGYLSRARLQVFFGKRFAEDRLLK